MSDIENMQLFENQPVRTAWNEEEEEWYFSVVDVIGILTDQPDSRRAAKYLLREPQSMLKTRLTPDRVAGYFSKKILSVCFLIYFLLICSFKRILLLQSKMF